MPLSSAAQPSTLLATAVLGTVLVAGGTAWVVQALRARRQREQRARAERELDALLGELKQTWREHMREPAVRIGHGRYELGAQLGVKRGLIDRDYDSLGNPIVYLVKPGPR